MQKILRSFSVKIMLVLFSISAMGQAKLTREAYIETYAALAMREMKRTGIPASIKLAQGCLESDDGNSRLTREANNHFGIKCHEWAGKKIYHDDDEDDECFRIYKNAEDSYIDHSAFLTEKSRYAALFKLKPDDYKAWAIGLKKAGYATSNKYAELLIRIIEDNELYKYDEQVLGRNYKGKNKEKTIEVEVIGRNILTNNRVEYIVVEQGETQESLKEELNLYPGEIKRYNNLEKGDKLEEGMIIYVQPKRRKAERGSDYHVLKEGEKMWDISQIYAIKLNRLYQLNNISPGEEPVSGTKLYLRKKLPMTEEIDTKEEESEPENDSPDMKFKFEGF
jgi:LysM repeat protein